MSIRINKILVEIATIFFNAAISFVPCFKYADSEDVILFTSRNIHYLVDSTPHRWPKPEPHLWHKACRADSSPLAQRMPC